MKAFRIASAVVGLLALVNAMTLFAFLFVMDVQDPHGKVPDWFLWWFLLAFVFPAGIGGLVYFFSIGIGYIADVVRGDR